MVREGIGLQLCTVCTNDPRVPAVQTWKEIIPDVSVLRHTLLINNALFSAENHQSVLLLHGCSQFMLINASRWTTISHGLGNEKEHLSSESEPCMPRQTYVSICSQVIKPLPVQQFVYSSEIIKNVLKG